MGFADAIQKATAKVTQIPGIGVNVTVRRVVVGSYNTTTGVIGETTTDTTVKAVFTDVNQREVNDLIQSDDRKCVIASADLSNIPTTADRIVYSGTSYQIIRVQTVSQAGTDISYTLYLRA